MRYLSAAEVKRALPMDALVDAVAHAFVAHHHGKSSVPPRLVLRGRGGTTLVMGARVENVGLAAKVVSVFPANAAAGRAVTNGLVVVLDPDTGIPALLCDGGSLTALRTGAASGAASRALMVPDCSVGAVLGCGAQAATQLLAIDHVANLDTVHVYGRNPDSLEAFIERMTPQIEATLVASRSPESAVEAARLVCVATSSSTPVFDGSALQPGTHVNAVGSFRLDMRELDARTVARSRVVVDDRDAALEESGELVAAIREGHTTAASWSTLGGVLSGEHPGRDDEDAITLFKSVGLALQDVAAGALALDRAEQLQLGVILPQESAP